MPTCLETTGPHDRFMLRAARLALRGRGSTAPNPCVGAVLAKDGEIKAEGWHKACGGPHAEVECLADARAKGVDPSACTLYVTLEPCNHQGKTPPCTKAILDAGIKRVVVGCADPNPHVTGGGAKALRAAGVEVVLGVQEALCQDLIDEFRIWQTTNRPYSILKMASTLDGKIAARGGRPQPVSCPESQADVHRLRAQVQAVIVGGNTFYGDNPQLTCRLDGDGVLKGFCQPLAVVVTSTLPKAYSTFNLLRQRPEQVLFWTSEYSAKTPLADELRERGTLIWGLPEMRLGNGEGLDFAGAFARLRQDFGCYRTLCEGGGQLALSLARQQLVDEFVLYLAPRVLGDAEGKSLFAGDAVQSMDETLNFRLAVADSCGQDLKLTYKPRS
ncbi:MAG: bifunctional diaminohydroxyphosphoribosylaminopyrimidine deaminase/5-amino-6-(5-phosphoribosylamino)uracil reductase RibD [Humidesulfovibrio sp.]|uniref:bifunctional diaminohydroxyphosphoribosylaminopyrimidine deaminase/5-amino-6-(5-phosphoribosylamino)uracil reductase RibD n=1 Tax=Humidesulfovibrio sp. TaxID=2910988 RepID=UPI0027E60917|nr:bifunctional diaminohydroxyphosphoribosylaminopyrimidine deaminase/5-amino-6-(5-phosphoribosylamino)uracil reductase RibD [Humidesulfovibrio sp.]MDQ7834908.1 bifunctional diaminohydroxyphosphoribosylaminopyrimidine deaminase/5-amino-6-(5-phosphoribosylamino)uracil reductase RibD [Humidesulfovibrio sp.]